MPIVHSVLIKVKPDVDSSGFVDLATSIISQSPTVSSFKIGHAINDPAKNKGFNFTIILEFEDEEGLERHVRGIKSSQTNGRLLYRNADDMIVNTFEY